MAVLLRRHRCRLLLILALILCFMLTGAAAAASPEDGPHACLEDASFSVLILGDSEMAGAGWEGGYANCIMEAYPRAKVLNLAKDGSLLANGEIHAQLELYLSEGLPMPDFILVDGGINDLPCILREEFKDTGLEMVKEALCSLIEYIHEAGPDTHIIYTLMPPLVEWKDSENGPPSYDIQERYWKRMNIIASTYEYVTVLDLFSLNPFRFPCGECYPEYFADSIHLNETGYRKTFEYIDNVLVARLARMMEE